MNGAPSSMHEQVLQRKQWAWKHWPTAFSTRSVIFSPHLEQTAREFCGKTRQKGPNDPTGRASKFYMKFITVTQKSAGILYSILTTRKRSVWVSSPYSSPHTQGSRPCHRTACPAGGDDSSYNRNNWSGRVYSWLELPAVYVTEPRHISHKALKDDRREEEKCWKDIRRWVSDTWKIFSHPAAPAQAHSWASLEF